MSKDKRAAITTRLLDRLAVDDVLLQELAGPSTLSAGEIASLRRSAALRRALRHVPLLGAAARAVFGVLRGPGGARR